MADRYPLVANASTLTLEELPSSDTILVDKIVISTSANLGPVANLKILGGTNNQVLKTDGTGNVSWATDSATPAGSNTYVQFNNNQNFGASAGMTFNTTNSTLTLGNSVNAPNITSTSRILTSGNLTSTGNVIAANMFINTSITFNTGSNAVFATGSYALMRSIDNATKFAALTGPGNIPGADGTYVAWSLPNTAGNVGEYLTTDGAGTMKFATAVSSSAPATASSTGQTGTIAFDSGNIYVCIATNTWKRVAIATW
jgi:hypothetical protein